MLRMPSTLHMHAMRVGRGVSISTMYSSVLGTSLYLKDKHLRYQNCPIKKKYSKNLNTYSAMIPFMQLQILDIGLFGLNADFTAL